MNTNDLSQRMTARWIAMCARRGRHPRAPSPSELPAFLVLLRAILAGPPSELATTPVTLHGHHQSRQLLETIQNLDRQMDTYENPELLVSADRRPSEIHSHPA